ncbi:Peroxisome chaperone and import receptor [Recurvomyces mirabilis]|uniref:Peroxisome chaperone and import receptor n=1 Tax=Recurvomyces mirabilis TaxID=574656 RepID=A0AAE0WL48_9PEZI|nr:Peroxisome chaperone and import receptor [Recurvomyces mirabilis]KAK5152147.1 Peroxisome chaperone and import receptor [Recurvomyces mirabilis]
MAEKPIEKVDMAPDPEEDDLDDLDDVLDQFQPKPTTTTKPASTPSTKPATTSAAPSRPFGDDAPSVTEPGEEELEKSLQAGMTDLMSELDSNPEMQQQFEKMMKELIAAGAAPSDAEAGAHLKEAAKTVGSEASTSAGGTKSTTASSTKNKGAEDFNSTIRRTMERMQQSDTSASASAAADKNGTPEDEDLLAQMMRELQSGEGSGMDGNEADFNSMLMNMMTQLTNKEILYEPMKELHEKFPGWMEKHANEEGGGGVKAEDLKRYQEQQKLVGEIVGRFERSGYKDENEADREFIVERMQKMQAAGSPPPDLVGDMSSAQEALGDIDAGCPTQ